MGSDFDSDSKPQVLSVPKKQIMFGDGSNDSDFGPDDILPRARVETFSGSIADKSPKPPDGGWGWMVVLACFICNFIIGKFQLLFQGFLLLHTYASTESPGTKLKLTYNKIANKTC